MLWEKEFNQIVKKVLKSLKKLNQQNRGKNPPQWKVIFTQHSELEQKTAFYQDMRFALDAIEVVALPASLEPYMKSIEVRFTPKDAAFFQDHALVTVGGTSGSSGPFVEIFYNEKLGMEKLLKMTSEWITELQEVVKHELEHRRQYQRTRGVGHTIFGNDLTSLSMEHPKKFSPHSRYLLLPLEVEAHVTALYVRARKRHLPAYSVLEQFLKKEERRITETMKNEKTVRVSQIPTALKEFALQEHKTMNYLLRSFYELQFILSAVKGIENGKGEKAILARIEAVLQRLRGGFFHSGEERTEKKLAQEEERMAAAFHNFQEEVSGALGALEHSEAFVLQKHLAEIKDLMKKLEPFSANLKKLCSRGGEIEQVLGETKSNREKISAAVQVIQGALGSVQSYETLVQELLNKTREAQQELEIYISKESKQQFFSVEYQIEVIKQVYLKYAKARYPQAWWD